MFDQHCLGFLRQLEQNNNREWFKANQTQYEAQVRSPALQFIENMSPHIAQLSPRLNAVAKKSAAA